MSTPVAVVVADTTPIISLAGVDEQKARKVATRAKIQIVGTLGLLLRAKQEGRITAIRPITDQFLRRKRYYTPTLIAQVLQAAGE